MSTRQKNRKHLSLQKSPLSPYKRAPYLPTKEPHIFPQKSPISLHKRALYSPLSPQHRRTVRPDDIWRGRCQCGYKIHAYSMAAQRKRALYLSIKELHISAKERYISTKEPYVLTFHGGQGPLWLRNSRLLRGGAACKMLSTLVSLCVCAVVWCCVFQVFPACKMLSMVVPFCVCVCVLQCV